MFTPRPRSRALPLALAVLAVLVSVGCGASGSDTCDATCDEVYPRFDDEVHALADGRTACTENAECEAVLPSMGCDDEKATWLSVCHVAVRGDEAQAFLDDVEALSADFCRDCQPECSKGPDCPTMFAAACRDGNCTIATVDTGQ